MNSFLDIGQVVLDQIKMGTQLQISREMLNPNNFKIKLIENLVNHAVLDITYKIAASAPNNIEFKCPANWWEAFRERWFPSWLLKKRPIKYRIERYSARVLYPKVQLTNQPFVFYIDKNFRGSVIDEINRRD